MKIAFLIVDTSNVGPVVFTKNLIEGLCIKKIDVDVYFIRDSLHKVDFSGFNIKKITLKDMKKINSNHYDIIHTTGAMPDLLGMLLVKKRRWVVGVHNFFETDLKLLRGRMLGGIYSSIWALSFKFGKNFIYSSDEMLQYYEAKFGRKNAAVIPYGIPEKNIDSTDSSVEEHSLLVTLKKKYKIVGSIGLLIKRKGFEQIIRVLSSDLNLCFVLIGDGPELTNLRKLADELGVSDRFYLFGYKQNTLPYYLYFDVYVTSSYSEGFGIAMIEAFRQGVPVVCSNLAIYKNYFPAEMLFNVGDYVELGQKIGLVVKDFDGNSKISRALFERFFNLDAMAKDHISYYNSIRIGQFY